MDDKEKKIRRGCVIALIVFFLFIISIIGIVSGIDEKTGKVEPDKYIYFLPVAILLLFLFFILIRAIYQFVLSLSNIPLDKISDSLINLSENVLSGKNGIRGYCMNPLVKSFICPHCWESILLEKINQITCPHCRETTESKFAFYLACPKCFSKIKNFSCPRCGKDIDIDAPYNHKELEEKRNG